MKSLQISKTARAFLLLGSAACIFTSSCAMSEKKAGETGSVVGAVLGGGLGYGLGKKHGRSKSDAVVGGLAGAAAGAGVGEEVGKKNTTLKGLEHVLPFVKQ